ncbi:MAG: asparagine synthase (glutamine-hydrolyzing) [Planctomycetota bacterium]
MCGIAGIFHFHASDQPIDLAILSAMTRSLAHRGPDGEGLWNAPGVGFGHRRLAILDLSDHGRQPMAYADGRLVITYNGEIYNFRELRAQLQERGHTFRSTGDTEVILAAYDEWGESVVEHLSGIYALAIWDQRRRAVFLARDPIGVKPLFYAMSEQTLRFGSEIKAILCDPAVSREVDDEALDAFLTFSYTPAPATGFRAVRQLLPGHCARVDEHGIRIRRYWQPPYAGAARAVDFETARDELSGLLERVTRAQMVSDVPVGVFLSGGLDSAAITRAAQRANLGPVQALTVGFDMPQYDERHQARQTAAALGVPVCMQEVRLEAAELVAELAWHVEEPTADSSMLPVYLLCRAARQQFTVALSGDGADEILAGYDTYRATALAAWYRRLPRFLRRGLIGPLARRLPVGDRKYGLHQITTRFTAGSELGPGRDHCAWRIIFNSELKRRLYTPDLLQRTAGYDPLGVYAGYIAEVPPGREPLAGLLHADTAFYLPNDMLVKIDRMSMAHGLEVRVPFLDVDMVRYCAALPGDFKLHRGKVRKHILRETLRGDIPDAVLNGPKSGFNIPLESWMRGPLRDLMFDAVATRRSELSRYLRLDELEHVANEHRDRRADHAHALFAVLMLALWFDNVAKGWQLQPAAESHL